MSAILAAIPKPVLALAAAVLAVLLAGQTFVAQRTATKLAEAREAHAQDRAAWADAAASSQAAERAREQAWTATNKDITDAYLHLAQQLAADRAAADAAGVRLHGAARATAARACPGRQDPATAGDGQAAGDAGFLLAQLFEAADQRAGELAAFADRAHAAGRECEQRYDALTAR